MRINFNSFGLGVGGGNRALFELSNRLINRGHDVTFTVVGRKGEHNWFNPVKAEIKYMALSKLQRAFRKFFFHDWNYDYVTALQQAIPDCDANFATHSFTAYPTVLSGKGKPFYFVQNYEPWFYNEPSLQLKAKLTYRMPLCKLVVSRWLQEKVGGTFVGNGLNLDVFKPSAEKPSKPPYRVMAFLRGIDWKGESLIVKTFGILKQQFPCELVVPRNVSDEELVALYSSSHVLLYPSQFEGFGYPPLEAMACGTPVVVTDCLGINEYARHLVNCYVSGITPEALASSVLNVLKDNALAEKLVKGGLETAREYDFERVVDRVEQAL